MSRWYLIIFIPILLLLPVTSWSVCVSKQRANLRSGPGAKYRKTWTVGKFTPLVVVDAKSGWYKVKDVDHETHWIHSSLVSSSIKCLTVKIKRASLRAGPGSKFPRTAYQRADLYTPFRKIDKQGAWYKVADASGNTFWIYETSVWRPVRQAKIQF